MAARAAAQWQRQRLKCRGAQRCWWADQRSWCSHARTRWQQRAAAVNRFDWIRCEESGEEQREWRDGRICVGCRVQRQGNPTSCHEYNRSTQHVQYAMASSRTIATGRASSSIRFGCGRAVTVVAGGQLQSATIESNGERNCCSLCSLTLVRRVRPQLASVAAFFFFLVFVGFLLRVSPWETRPGSFGSAWPRSRSLWSPDRG